MSLYAAIDVGSHTLRLLISGFVDGKLTDVYAGREITRLGNMVDQTGMLRQDSMAASIRALRTFSSVMAHYGVDHVRAVATSALREAANTAGFTERVREETGIRIGVISGEGEARLTLRGILYAFLPGRQACAPAAPDPLKGKKAGRQALFIIDIGGGSTEWISYGSKGRIVTGSIPSGVIKLARTCITADPVTTDDIRRLNREIRTALKSLGAGAGPVNSEHTLFVGTGGTCTTIASVDLGLASYSRDRIHLHRLPLPVLRRMQRAFLNVTLEERKRIRGLEPGRADLIIPGLQFTMKVMELLRFRELIVSDYGLLEGAILEMREESETGLSQAGKS